MFLDKKAALSRLIRMTMPKAIDVSSAPPPTQQQCDCLKQLGVVKAIVGTSYGYGGDPAARVAAYKNGGLQVAEYQFPQRPMVPITDEWWCDVETPPGCTQDEVRAACNNDPRPMGLYSSPVMWNACGFSGWNVKAEFPWLKVWVANYGPLPRPFTPFGGFTKADVAMVQYQGTTMVCGLQVDMNEIIEEPVPPHQEEDMPKLVWNTDLQRVYLVGFQQPIWITSQAEVDQLTKAYGAAIALSNSTMQQMVT